MEPTNGTTHTTDRRASRNTVMRRIRRLSPVQSLVLGFALIAFVGAFLLCLPVSNTHGEWQFFLDALFTATSGVSTTGLIVVDTGSYYTLFGQIVILVLIQIGGVGYMAFLVALAFLLRRPLSLTEGFMFGESMAGVTRRNVKQMVWAVFALTFVFEGLGTLIFAFSWLDRFPVGRAVYIGLFHSISAFCTAGFSLFADSFVYYRHSAGMTIFVSILSTIGGIGFFALDDIRRWFVARSREEHPNHLALHTRLALSVTSVMSFLGIVILLVSEKTDATSGFWESVFQAVTAASTTGFNTVDIGAMSAGGLFTLVLLMYVGASPGSTGGGIKTTTWGVSLVSLWTHLRGGRESHIFRRHIEPETVMRAHNIALLAGLWIAVTTLILSLTESSGFLALLFEETSALGTVGLSAGATPYLSNPGKMVIIASMFIGRVGPVALGASLIRNRKERSYRFADEEVRVG